MTTIEPNPMEDFDESELADESVEPDSVHRILDELTPIGDAEPLLYNSGLHLLVGYASTAGSTLLRFRTSLVFRYGSPDASKLTRHRLSEHGLTGPGLYQITNSSDLFGPVSWIGSSIGSEAWKNTHFVVVFSTGLLECMSSWIDFEVAGDGQSPTDSLVRRMHERPHGRN